MVSSVFHIYLTVMYILLWGTFSFQDTQFVFLLLTTYKIIINIEVSFYSFWTYEIKFVFEL